MILLAGLLFCLSMAKAPGSEKPNFIIVFTDDQGFADVGAYGHADDVLTPHTDRLAEEGVMFTHGYVTSPVCAPSRLGLMSGQYQQRFNVYDNSNLPFVYEGTPVAERLREVGYRTGMVGKLHLPIEDRGGQNAAHWGFDEFFMDHGMFQQVPDRRLVTHHLDGSVTPEGTWVDVEGYRTDLHTKAALQFIERNKDEPFFLYLPYFAPHTPLEATEEYLKRFPDVEPEARRYGLAMVAAIDDGVGKILQLLEENGLLENTYIFFMSDNGAPLKARDHTLPISELNFNEWNGGLNFPAAGEKGMLTDGGIRVPFIAYAPGNLPSGKVVDTPVISLDVTATVLTLAEADTRDLEGLNLMPLLVHNQEADFSERPLFWYHGGHRAIRIGDWKYISVHSVGDYLFDLSEGPTEHYNRIFQRPDIKATLQTRLNQWLESLPERETPPRPLQLQLEERLFNEHLLPTE